LFKSKLDELYAAGAHESFGYWNGYLALFVLRPVLRYCRDMDSPVTLRLDKQTRERVARIARQNRVSASDVIRTAGYDSPLFRNCYFA